MKKITLLFLSLVAGTATYAQNTCATALPISLTAGNVVAAVDGTRITLNCADTSTLTGTSAEWYTYTATATGTLNLNSNVTGNTSDDTRVSVYSGACGALTCVAGNDDISATNFLSDVTFNVTAGTVYTIAWDNRWNSAGFTFNATFTPVACPSPTNVALTAFTTTTATVSWANTGNFEVEYGEFPYTQGSMNGTTGTVTAGNSFQLTNLTPGVAYNFFVRENCGMSGFSTYSTAIAGTSPSPMVTFPFSEDLEPDANQALLLNLGISFFTNTNNWAFGQDDLTDGNTANDFASNGVSYVFSNNTFTNNAADATIYFGPFNLMAGTLYTFNVDQRTTALANATTPNKDIELLAAPMNNGTTNTILATFDDLTNTTHQLRTGTFTPTTSGLFYFGVRDKSTILTGVAAGNSVVIDNIRLTATLGVTDVNDVKLTHFYNLVNQSFNIQSSNGAINTVAVYNLLGQEVSKLTVNDVNAVVNMSDLNNGVYVAKVTLDGKEQAIKFVKE